MRTGNEPADQLSRSLDLLWQVDERSKPGPKPALTLERIVDTAVVIADSEGIDALNMRRVAEELGVGAMSLYRYVPGKIELLNLMLDRVHAPTQDSGVASGATWRAVTAAHARQSWRRYLAHPWLLQVNWSRPVLGPHMVADFDAALAALEDIGLDDPERVMIDSVIDGYVSGVARSYVASRDAEMDSGLSDEEYLDYLAPVLKAAAATGNYPAVARLSDQAFSARWDEVFTFGLERLLDGLEQFVDRDAPGGGDEPTESG